MPGEIRREKQRGIQENISFRGKSLYCTRLNESLLKARSRAYGIIRKYERYTEDGIKTPNILYGVAIKGASRGGIKLSASAHSFASAHAHASIGGALCHECTIRLQSCMCTRKKWRDYNLPATASPSSYIFSDVFFPRRLFLLSFLILLYPPFLSSFSPSAGNLRGRLGNKRESHATNVFPATFESRPSGDE